MGRKGKHAAAGKDELQTQDKERGQALLQEGEDHLEAERCRDALRCFDEAVSLIPTNQTAWYHRGVAASELWQEGQPGEHDQLVHLSCGAFRRVLELDTSKRGEVRYLSTLALAQFLTSVAETASDDDGGTHVAAQAVGEAMQLFTDASELQARWGHEAFDDEAWGAWGAALALQLRLDVTKAEEHSCGDGAGARATAEELEAAARLCSEAAEKFSMAAASSVAEQVDGSDDVRWLMLHAEHLLRFVELMRSALVAPRVDKEPHGDLWWSRASAAWTEALSLAVATTQLVGSTSWEPWALRGDVFARGAGLLGEVAKASSASVPLTLRLPMSSVATSAAAAGAIEDPFRWDASLEHVDEQSAISYAEVAYAEALRCGSEEAVVPIHLQIGEMHWGIAKRRESREHLSTAVAAYQKVTSIKTAGSEALATAFYNLACIAASLDKPDKATEALQTSIQACSSDRERQQTLREALADRDLVSVREHPEFVAMMTRFSLNTTT